MAKNILIFSDGTGQRAGIRTEERESNVYKLYRSSRCGPDSINDPGKQMAFYDPGIGTLPEGIGYLEGAWRKIYNLVSQATGYGITMNMVDCYSEIIQMWRPGDRIVLIGFSRGAYTVRCLGAALVLCGIPTRLSENEPMKYDGGIARKLAKEAVKKVYQHVSSSRDTKYLPQREEMAREFRSKYASGSEAESNGAPYFIGVFDTVASLMNTQTMLVSAALILGFLAVLSAAIHFILKIPFSPTMISVAGTALAGILGAFIFNNLKFACGLKGYSFWQTLHWRPSRLKFYNRELSLKVNFARHAISIDEQRGSFPREPWGAPKVWREMTSTDPAWLKQVWFAGNHSDVGGSYSENESRLSDISLAWMADQMKSLPNPVHFDESFLRNFPDPLGMQHDELKASWLFRLGSKYVRPVGPDAKLHSSVLQRFAAEKILNFDVLEPYRPENLRDHHEVRHFYQ